MRSPLAGVGVVALCVTLTVGPPGGSTATAGSPCTIDYTGGYAPSPLDWDQPQNWSPARKPGTSDYACIPAAFHGGTVAVGSGPSVRGMSVLDPAGLRVTNFGITLTDAHEISTVTNIDVSSLATMTVDKGVTLRLSGSKATVGLTGFGSAALAGAGTVEITGTAGFGAGIQGSLAVTVARGATVKLRSGYFDQSHGASFRNYGTVVIAPAPSRNFVDQFGRNSAGSFVNEKGATISDPTGAARFTFAVPFRNAGAVLVNTRQTLEFDGGGSATGPFTASAGGRLRFGGGVFDLRHARLSGPGTFDFGLGTIDLAGQRLQHVSQCATVRGPFIVTRTWRSAACVSNGVAELLNDHGKHTTTRFTRGAKAILGYGGFLIVAGHHRLVSFGRLIDHSDICIADGGQLRNSGTLIGRVAPNGTTTRAIHPNCGIAGPIGRLVNSRGGVIRGTSATVDITVRLTNHGRLAGEVTHS